MPYERVFEYESGVYRGNSALYAGVYRSGLFRDANRDPSRSPGILAPSPTSSGGVGSSTGEWEWFFSMGGAGLPGMGKGFCVDVLIAMDVQA